MKNNIVLIDSNLKDTNVLLSSLNAETLGIVYNYSTSRKAILHQIEDEFGGKTVSRVAICCHGGESRFLENGTFFDVDGSTNEILKNANSQFLLDLLETTYKQNLENIIF